MKYCFIILVVSLQINSLCIAQEIITISDKNFNQYGGLSLTGIDGWLFTQQKIPDWNEPDLYTHDWEKLNPNNLSFKYAHKNGFVEGWFRLRFKVDSALWGQVLYLNILPTGAAKMYINGVLYDEAGNPNKDPDIDTASISYFARIDSGWLPKPITLDSVIYTIAVYCTDHDRYFLDKYSLRSMKAGFDITLFKKEFLFRHIKMLGEYNFFQGIWLSGILLLSFLFGILLLLNRNDKILRLIAILTFILAFSAIFEFFHSNSSGVWLWDVHDLLYYECIALAVGFIPITLSQIILKKVNKKMFLLWILLAFIYPIIWYFSGSTFMENVTYSIMGVTLLTVAIISTIMIISNRKKLGKAELSVVWGLIILVLWMLIHTIFINIGFGNNAYRLATVAMIYLTLPIALLVYISIRFRDNIFMLRKNLVEISKLSDEKIRAQEEKQKITLSQNEMLEKKVSERTTDLLIKNSELEIEASLERVRAVAMGMNKSDDLLSICEASFKEFQKLGFDSIRNAIIHIPNDEQKYFNDYDYSEFTGGAITKIKYGSHPIVDEYLEKIRSAEDAYFEVVINEDELAGWRDFRKKSGQQNDPRLDSADALYYNLFSIGIGDIGISTFKPIDESQIKILKRFRNVFDLAYRRYNDIALAEEQARETQIQLALERVRAKTMAMQSSNELKEVVLNMFDGLKSVGVDPTVCNISLIDPETCDSDVWSAHQTDNGLITYRVFISHFEHSFRKKLIDSFLNKISFSVHELSGDLKKSYIQYLIDHVDYSKVPEEVTKSNEKLVNIEEGIVLSAAYMKFGLLIVSRNHAISSNESDILQRFAKIFEQTYTRFLDLQKAEAQAKEAQIEAALERVRSRTMGMQKSEELREVIQVVFEQFVQLKINIDHAGFVVDYTPKGDWHFWIADQQEIPSKITHPYFDSVWAHQFNEAKEKGIDFFATNLNFKEKNKFYNELLSYVPRLPEASKDFYLSCPGLAISTVLLENVALYIENFSGIPYSENENKILIRFGRVFQQTYTRFLDLQKAEAQAREAQIELSLERIRAQVTAMRESSELLDIVVTMRSEFVDLGYEAHYFWHMRWLPDRYEKAMTSGDGARIGMVMTLPRHIHGDIKLVDDWEKSEEPTIVFPMDVDTAVSYVEKMITLGDFEVVDPQAPTLDDIRHIGGLTFIMARTTHGEIGFSLPGTVINPSEEAVDTLTRFAGVFDLAYKRFVDLQKAEEQNRIIQSDNDRKTKELEDARQLQLSMLPKELPQLPNLDIAVYMKTATEVGGDYYDFIVDENGTLTVVVGDATGHGMMSGMMVSIMKSFFISNRSNFELKQFFENANNSIKDMQLGRLMMALIGVQITSEKIIATNAGMPSLLYYRNKSQKAGEFVSNNLPLGGMKGTKYLLKAVRYERGDTILLMSDGFAELKNSQNEQYGYARIKEKFRSLVDRSSSEIIEELKNKLAQWSNGSEPDDDITFVVIKFK